MLITRSADEINAERARRNTIYVYNDFGALYTCFQMLKSCLEEFAPEYTVKSIDGRGVLAGTWCRDAAAIAFGGGFDKGYMKTLDVDGCKIIREYIREGGTYLGICAGAYFACGRCIFDQDGPNHINESRYIRVFPGNGIGPAYPGYEYNSEKGASASPLKAETIAQRPPFVKTYFNGGCYFDVKDYHPTDVLYRYKDLNEPAVILSRLGDGHAVLSGAHFEFDPIKMEKIAGGNPYLVKILPDLLDYNAARKRICRYLISHLLLKSTL